MPSQELLKIAEATLSSIQPGTLTDESVQKLRTVFPDTLILAALDLIDKSCIIKYTTPWGRSHYEVLGSTSTYTVFTSPTSGSISAISVYCNCPAFAYAVLMTESHVLCKHVLATRLAQQLSRCVERIIKEDELAIVMAHQGS